MLGRDQRRQLIHVGRDQFAELEQHTGALRQRNIAPGIGGGAGRSHGGIQVSPVRQPQLRADLARSRVEHRAGVLTLTSAFAAVDEVVDDRGLST